MPNAANSNLNIHPEVQTALRENKPVVALESTIISHGLPWPDNLNTAKQLEAEVRRFGAIPATIAILKGQLKVGLSTADLKYLADPQANIFKASRADIPILMVKKADGATTVAATMFIAALAKIPIFATGGIGGVHRGGATNFDISADLRELAQTNVAVICAGAKAILDLKLTLEYLETHGVPVIGYQTNELPAFWYRQSGLKTMHQAADPEELAAILKHKWGLGLRGGAVITNPVPEEFALDAEQIEQAIATAIADAVQKGVHGKNITPYLLKKISESTGGASLNTNIQLVLNNARLAAQVANAYVQN